MPTIQLTDQATLNVTSSIERYLEDPLSFVTHALHTTPGTRIADVPSDTFPLQASATGAGQFAVGASSLALAAGATATLNLLSKDAAAGFSKALEMPAPECLISFAVQGTVSGGVSARAGDFCFGIKDAATVTVTTFSPAAPSDAFGDAVKRAIAAITIPHAIADLQALPAGAICRLDASSCLKFTASVTYSILNNPLATVPVSRLPAIAVNASAGATLEATASHTADHTITIAKVAGGMIHLSVSLTRTDDFETSLTASASLTAGTENHEALAFLLGKIGPDSKAEMNRDPGGPARQGRRTQ